MGPMGAHGLVGDVTEYVDRRAPGLVRVLAAMRWGGLRTVRPDNRMWFGEAGAALGLGLVTRRAVTAATGNRVRPPGVLSVAIGWSAVHLAVWRWDTVRWRRRRVAMVVDLPVDEVIALTEQLRSIGYDVERWERVRGPVRVHGIWCRSADLRSVNRELDELSRR